MGALIEMIRYNQGFLVLCQSEVEPLAAMEWEESGHPSEPLDIDWDRYTELEEQGIVRFFTARSDG